MLGFFSRAIHSDIYHAEGNLIEKGDDKTELGVKEGVVNRSALEVELRATEKTLATYRGNEC